MTKPTLSDLPPRYQAQAIAQLHAMPRPRTVQIAPVEDDAPAPVKPKRKHPQPDATGWFTANGLPAPVREHRFHPVRKFRFDYAWPDAQVALEVEGGVWTGGRHTRGTGFLRDMEKYNHAAVRGWYVVRCTPDTLCTDGTIQMLKELLNQTK